MNTIYIYDGTFEGFLCAVFQAYEKKERPKIRQRGLFQAEIGAEYSEIQKDVERAERVYRGIEKRSGKKGAQDIAVAFASAQADKEGVIFDLLSMLFKDGNQILRKLSDPVVIAYNSLLQRVEHEIGRMYGFVRFRELENGIFYGTITPDNDILELILPHFASRFNTLRFVIHDLLRAKASACGDGEIYFFNADETIEFKLSEKELSFQNMWKDYHKSISIAERENSRLQNNFLPKRYRRNMPEFP